jgi:hypothetical protein
MNKFWSRQANESTEAPGSAEGDSLKMIPLWSIVLAIVVFVWSTWFFVLRPEPQHHHQGSLPMRLMIGYTTGAALASYALLVGYVSRDVKRRNMSAPSWMLMVVVMPGGIGAVVYFLLRQPILIRCPSCTTELTAGVHFCPQCRFQVAPVCGQCFRGVQITDAFCPQCGHDVVEDRAPARLRAYSDS